MLSLLNLLGLVLLFSQAQALYFYIDGSSQKCFFEELPKDTLVVGMVKSTGNKKKEALSGIQDISKRHYGMRTRGHTIHLLTW